jgi:DNA-directed RNA polymerase
MCRTIKKNCSFFLFIFFRYGGVAKLVAARVAEDAAKGVRFGEMLNGKIDRKIVKQTVMTSVYGVTFVGARKQIFNAMRSRLPSLSEDDVYQASGYITRHTFSSLEEMFTPARKIMAWLGECARRIAKSGKPVEWVTPLGLPVVQVRRNDYLSHRATTLTFLIALSSRWTLCCGHAGSDGDLGGPE